MNPADVVPREPRCRLNVGHRAAARVLGACHLALAFAAAAQVDAPRLLTDLSAEVGPDGVALYWAVDESRAGRIAGFSCVYRTPGHLKLGVAGTVPCGPQDSPPEARSRTVDGLPEYGEYLFEVVARTNAGPGIPWPERALHLRLVVSEELAGPPGVAVTGAGPLVEGCGPGDEAAERPWHLDEIVSAEHLSHPPGRGWVAGGDSSAAPDWPEPQSFHELIDAATAEGAASGDADALASTARAVLARADRTRALLRSGPDGGRELKLHSSYPFGAVYAYEEGHAVSGWADGGDPVLWPRLWNRESCPPPAIPNATHDVALALAETATGDGRRLQHSGYGWWTVAPVGVSPDRVVAAMAGLSFGEPAEPPVSRHARWRGRLSGHLFLAQRRWALAGDLNLELSVVDGHAQLTGRVENVAGAPLDAQSLQPVSAEPGLLPPLILGTGSVAQGDWSGTARIGHPDPDATLTEFPGADAFRGDWQAAIHGPDGLEAAGRLRLWTPLEPGLDPETAWREQAVLVAGFGATRTDQE